MLGKIFGIIAVLSALTAIFTGRIEAVGTAVTSGANDAVKLTISLAGMMCLWSGIVRVLKAVGLMEVLSKAISPVLKILLPHTYNLKKQGNTDAASALQSVSANIGANMLGIGNAATPIGIDAIKKLNDVKRLTESQYKSKTKIVDNLSVNTASSDMIMFVVLNCASVQLIPTTLIALRSAAGSENVFGIIPAVWICSAATAVFAVVVTKLFKLVWEKVIYRK
ncbi:MAG: spore maturation protein A [Oscillospiraceae bacterium]|nr:spore maturation protein A [Oscillospiraceae bacterium]